MLVQGLPAGAFQAGQLPGRVTAAAGGSPGHPRGSTCPPTIAYFILVDRYLAGSCPERQRAAPLSSPGAQPLAGSPVTSRARVPSCWRALPLG